MNLDRGQTVLITGASGGIGYELAQVFAQNQSNLVLVARSADRLQQIAQDFQQRYGIETLVIVQDLTLADAPTAIFNTLKERGIQVDILINNAGFGTYGLFTEIDLNTELQLLQVNIVALTHLTKLFAAEMATRGSGKILNVASTAAFQPGPLMAVYYASKAYVLSLSEALANELQPFGVTVSVLCPGPTASGFQDRAQINESKLIKGQKIMTATEVAKIAYQKLAQNQTVIIPGFKNQVLAFFVRFLPRKMLTQMVRSMQEKSGG